MNDAAKGPVLILPSVVVFFPNNPAKKSVATEKAETVYRVWHTICKFPLPHNNDLSKLSVSTFHLQYDTILLRM